MKMEAMQDECELLLLYRPEVANKPLVANKGDQRLIGSGLRLIYSMHLVVSACIRGPTNCHFPEHKDNAFSCVHDIRVLLFSRT